MQGQIQEFKKGGVQQNFFQKGGGEGGPTTILGTIDIENKQNLLKNGPLDPLDLSLLCKSGCDCYHYAVWPYHFQTALLQS